MRYRYLGLANETVHGTPADAAVYADPESVSLDPPDGQALFWPGVSGVDRQVAAGPYDMSGDISLLVDDILSGYWWRWLLGQYATVGTAVGGGGSTALSGAAAAGATLINVNAVLNFAVGDQVQVGTGDTAEVHRIAAGGVGANTLTFETALRFAHNAAETVVEVANPYTHTFSFDGQPTLRPFTARVGKDILEHVFSGCVLDGVKLEVAGDLVKATLNVLASQDAKAALAAAPVFGEGNVFAPHDITVQINSIDESTRVEGLTVEIGNNADLAAGRTVGSRYPRRGYRGALEVTVQLNLAFIDAQELERFWGQAAGPANTLSEFPLSVAIGPNIDLVFPRGVYVSIGEPIQSGDRIEQAADFRALVDSGGDGPILVTITNAWPNYGS